MRISNSVSRPIDSPECLFDDEPGAGLVSNSLAMSVHFFEQHVTAYYVCYHQVYPMETKNAQTVSIIIRNRMPKYIHKGRLRMQKTPLSEE